MPAVDVKMHGHAHACARRPAMMVLRLLVLMGLGCPCAQGAYEYFAETGCTRRDTTTWDLSLDPSNTSDYAISRIHDDAGTTWISVPWVDVAMLFDTGSLRNHGEESMYVRVHPWYNSRIDLIELYTSEDLSSWSYHADATVQEGVNPSRLLIVGATPLRYVRIDFIGGRRGSEGNWKNWGLREIVFSDCGPVNTTTSSTSSTTASSSSTTTTSTSATSTSTTSRSSSTTTGSTSTTSSSTTSTSTTSSTSTTMTSTTTTTSSRTSTSTSTGTSTTTVTSSTTSTISSTSTSTLSSSSSSTSTSSSSTSTTTSTSISTSASTTTTGTASTSSTSSSTLSTMSSSTSTSTRTSTSATAIISTSASTSTGTGTSTSTSTAAAASTSTSTTTSASTSASTSTTTSSTSSMSISSTASTTTSTSATSGTSTTSTTPTSSSSSSSSFTSTTSTSISLTVTNTDTDTDTSTTTLTTTTLTTTTTPTTTTTITLTTPTPTPTSTASSTSATPSTSSFTATSTSTAAAASTSTSTSSSSSGSSSVSVSTSTPTSTSTSATATATPSTTTTTTSTTTTTATTSSATTSTSTITAAGSTLIPSSPAAQVIQFLDEVLDTAPPEILTELAEEGKQVVQWRTSRGAVQASSLSQKSDNSTNESVVVEVEGSEVVVSVPVASVLAGVSVRDDESLGLLVTVFNNSNLQELESTSSAGTDGRQVKIRVMTMVSIDIVLFSSRGVSKLEVEGVDPIEFSLGTGLASDLQCVYWDEVNNEWSSKGLATAADNSPDKPFVCTTTHLSLFAAIWKGYTSTLACSQLFVLFTLDAMQELVKGRWPLEMGSLAAWAVLAMLLIVSVAAAHFDQRQAHSCSWDVEYFLVAAQPECAPEVGPAPLSDDESEQSDTPKDYIGACVGAGTAMCMTCIGSSAFRDAVDDIMSSWFEYFGDVRTFIEEICGAFELEGCSIVGSFNLVGFRLTSHLLIAAMRRLTGASLGVSEELVAFVMEDEDLLSFLTEGDESKRVTAPFRSSTSMVADLTRERSMGQASIELRSMSDGQTLATPPTPLAMPHCVSTNSLGPLASGTKWQKAHDKWEAWVLLHDQVSQALVAQGLRYSHGYCPCLRMVWELFMVQNPFQATFVFNPFMSCKMRALFFTLDIMGTFALSIMFFEASGSVKGKSRAGLGSCSESDEESETLGFKLGRLLAVATASTLIAGLPVALLVSLHTRSFKKMDFPGSRAWNRQLRAWRFQDKIIWCCGSMYAFLCLIFLLLFLANLGEDDQQDFAMSVLLMVAQVCFIIPLFVSIATPTMAWAALNVAAVIGGKGREDLVRRVHKHLFEESNIMLPIMRI